MDLQKNKYLKIFSLILFAISFSACSSEQNYLVNLSFVKDAIINYHESGRFDKDVTEAIEKTKKEFDKITPAKNSVVIFDVDATSLSDYTFDKNWDFGYIEKDYNMWIDSANAKAVPGVLDFYNYLIDRGFKIIFITGRKDFQYGATMKNLKEVGFTKFDTLIVKDKAHYETIAAIYKPEMRAQLVAHGYKIEGTLGDQWSDLKGPNHGIQIKIPNYQYLIK